LIRGRNRNRISKWPAPGSAAGISRQIVASKTNGVMVGQASDYTERSAIHGRHFKRKVRGTRHYRAAENIAELNIHEGSDPSIGDVSPELDWRVNRGARVYTFLDYPDTREDNWNGLRAASIGVSSRR